MPRIDVPSPGRALTFPEWSAAIVAEVRARIPAIRAARKGSRHVIIRYAGREAYLEDDGGAFCIRFRAGDGLPTMSGLGDRDRRDAFTVGNMAHSVAGYFDARFTRAENP